MSPFILVSVSFKEPERCLVGLESRDDSLRMPSEEVCCGGSYIGTTINNVWLAVSTAEKVSVGEIEFFEQNGKDIVVGKGEALPPHHLRRSVEAQSVDDERSRELYPEICEEHSPTTKAVAVT